MSRSAALLDALAPFMITTDTREPEHTAWKFTARCAVTRKAMATGDYAPTGFENVFAIERKALGDLVSCVGVERQRFTRELERFAPFEFRAIIVEASLADVAAHKYHSKIEPASVVGSVLSWHIDYAVPTIWAGSPRAAAGIAERLMRRFVEKHQARRCA